MRFWWMIALAALSVSFQVLPAASGEGWTRSAERWAYPGSPKRWGYYPHDRHDPARHYEEDPYAYSYQPRGYYPYYNSGYWRSAKEMRQRPKTHLTRPPYYQAWGYQDWRYQHRSWHNDNHGGHWIGHW